MCVDFTHEDYCVCGNCGKEFPNYYLAETADSAGNRICICPFCASEEVVNIEVPPSYEKTFNRM